MNKIKECPVCSERSFKYDSKLKANRCYNEICGFSDKVGIAPDVPMSFLEFCLSEAKSPARKNIIKKIIKKAKTADKKYNTNNRGYTLD